MGVHTLAMTLPDSKRNPLQAFSLCQHDMRILSTPTLILQDYAAKPEFKDKDYHQCDSKNHQVDA